MMHVVYEQALQNTGRAGPGARRAAARFMTMQSILTGGLMLNEQVDDFKAGLTLKKVPTLELRATS